MVTLRKFYKAGLIDPDFATISDEEFVKEITDGKILFLFSEYLCCLNTEEQGDWNGMGKSRIRILIWSRWNRWTQRWEMA